MSKTKDALRAYIRSHIIEIETRVQQPYTMVEILVRDDQQCSSAQIAGKLYYAFAKCNPVDKWNPERGYEIALGRAVKQAMDDYEQNQALNDWNNSVDRIIEQTLA